MEYGAHAVRRLSPRPEVLWRKAGCGPASLIKTADGWAVTCYDEDALHWLGRDGKTRRSLSLTAALGSPAPAKAFGPNDLSGDGRGGLFVTLSGVFEAGAPATGRILHLPKSGPPRVLAQGLAYPNGIALSPDGARLYVSEHLKNRVLAFERGKAGRFASPPRVFFDLAVLPPPSGEADPLTGPDGLKAAADGSVWVAQYGGARIVKLSPEGALASVLPVPERYPTNLALAGADLFVTAVEDPYKEPYPGIVRRLPRR